MRLKPFALSIVAATVLLGIPTAASATGSSSVHYRSCPDAWAKGAENIRRGEPGYRKGLDADNDGIACDKKNHGDHGGKTTTTRKRPVTTKNTTKTTTKTRSSVVKAKPTYTG